MAEEEGPEDPDAEEPAGGDPPEDPPIPPQHAHLQLLGVG